MRLRVRLRSHISFFYVLACLLMVLVAVGQANSEGTVPRHRHHAQAVVAGQRHYRRANDTSNLGGGNTDTTTSPNPDFNSPPSDPGNNSPPADPSPASVPTPSDHSSTTPSGTQGESNSQNDFGQQGTGNDSNTPMTSTGVGTTETTPPPTTSQDPPSPAAPVSNPTNQDNNNVNSGGSTDTSTPVSTSTTNSDDVTNGNVATTSSDPPAEVTSTHSSTDPTASNGNLLNSISSFVNDTLGGVISTSIGLSGLFSSSSSGTLAGMSLTILSRLNCDYYL